MVFKKIFFFFPWSKLFVLKRLLCFPFFKSSRTDFPVHTSLLSWTLPIMDFTQSKKSPQSVKLPLWAWVEKTVYGVVKKKFLAPRPVKKVTLTFFWDIKEPITIDFLEKTSDCKQFFLLVTPKAKFTLFIEWFLHIKMYKVGDRGRRWPEGSFF